MTYEPEIDTKKIQMNVEMFCLPDKKFFTDAFWQECFWFSEHDIAIPIREFFCRAVFKGQ